MVKSPNRFCLSCLVYWVEGLMEGLDGKRLLLFPTSFLSAMRCACHILTAPTISTIVRILHSVRLISMRGVVAHITSPMRNTVTPSILTSVFQIDLHRIEPVLHFPRNTFQLFS